MRAAVALAGHLQKAGKADPLQRRRDELATRRQSRTGPEMDRLLDWPAEDVLAAVEAAAAEGDDGADWLLSWLLEEEAETGSLSVIGRLAAGRYIDVRWGLAEPPRAGALTRAEGWSM